MCNMNLDRFVRLLQISAVLALAALFWAASVIALRAQTAPEPAIKNIFWQPNQLQQGSPAFITVELNRVAVRVSGTWTGKTLTFFRSDDPKIWHALAGADLDTQPGNYDLSVTALLSTGKRLRLTKRAEIAAASFKPAPPRYPSSSSNLTPRSDARSSMTRS